MRRASIVAFIITKLVVDGFVRVGSVEDGEGDSARLGGIAVGLLEGVDQGFERRDTGLGEEG